MSAMGIYAVTPGTPRYAIGTPHFDEMTVHVAPGKSLHIVAKGAEAGRYYIRSVRLNGVRLDRWYLLHREVVGGGELVFEMSDRPNLTQNGQKSPTLPVK
jgi:putative alpha-1,2-mannosidase